MEGLSLPTIALEISPQDLTITDFVAKGGYGEVWKGIWNGSGNGTVIAVKKIPITGNTLSMQQEITTELKMLTKFSHPNILPVYGGCFVPGELWVILEYIAAGSLFDLLHSEKQIEWNIKLRLMQQAAKAVAVLHNNNPCILHRDLKSPNFLVSQDYTLKLCDFGMAKAYSFATATLSTHPREALGTTRWSAPETLIYPPKWTNKADIYSLGITLYEISLQKIPFEETHGDSLIWAICNKCRPNLQDCPQKLTEIISKCWDDNPNNRLNINQLVEMLATDALRIELEQIIIKNSVVEVNNSTLFDNYIDESFLVKSVGVWNEGDVSNWLCYIGLGTYCQNFVAKHINGVVLLSLTQNDLKVDFKMTILHQKVVMSAIDDLFDVINWDNSHVLEWITEKGLYSVNEKLKDSGMNGKALLGLTDQELEQYYHIQSAASRKRLLSEIKMLKLQSAKVYIKELYSYPLLKDIIKPVRRNQYGIFRFHPDVKHMFRDIIECVKDKDSSFGLLQTDFQKFLFVVVVLAHVYKSNYNGCKFLWFDANQVEIAAIRYEYLKFFLMKTSDLNQTLQHGKSFLNFDQLYLLMQEITAYLLSISQGSNSHLHKFSADTQGVLDNLCGKQRATVADLFEKSKSEPVNSQSPAVPETQNSEAKNNDNEHIKQTKEFVQQIWLQYSFIESIANELFPIFDRNNHGYLGLGEVLAGLDVAIFGSTVDRIKMAFCIADYNGDGYLSPEEVNKFYEKVFKIPFQAIAASGLLSEFPTKRHGVNYTIESYVLNYIQDILDPTLPAYLNKELITTFYSDNTTEKFAFAPKVKDILTAEGRSLISRGCHDMYLGFKLRKKVIATNLYLRGCQEIRRKNIENFKNGTIWLCTDNAEWTDLLQPIQPDTITKIDINLENGAYMFEHTLAVPKKDTEYVYIHLKSPGGENHLIVEFFGIWGFFEEQQKYPPHKTLDLFVRAGGILTSKVNVEILSSVGIAEATAAYFAFANEYADSAKITSEESTTVLKRQMDDLTSSMSYVKAKKGSSDVNQVRILKDLLPFVNLFMILRGQNLENVLESAF